MENRVDLLIGTGLTGLVLTGAIVFTIPEPQPSGWGGAGSVQSISISLGAGQAETGKAEVDAQSAASVDSVVARQSEAPEEIIEPDPVAEPEPVQEVEPESQSEPEPEPEVVEVQPDPIPESIAEEKMEPKPEPEPEPVVVQQLAEVLPVRTKPKPPVSKSVISASTKVAEPVKQAPKPITQPAGQTNSVKSEGATGEDSRSQAASSSSGSGGGAASKAAMVDYQASVLQILSRFREYPERAIRRKIQGVNRIRLVIGRDGSVLEATMVTSSGTSILDRETRRMIDRVQHFPPFPDEMVENRVVWVVPVVYELN